MLKPPYQTKNKNSNASLPLNPKEKATVDSYVLILKL